MRIKLWSLSDISKLKDWYKLVGDTELSNMLNTVNEYNKFTKNSIEKKRGYLKLKRSKAEVRRIMSDNSIIPKLKDGEIFIVNDHRFIKIDGKIISYSRWHYVQHYEIPEGFIIFYKDFDTLNDSIINLEVRKRQGFVYSDFKKALKLITKNIDIELDYNKDNWYKMSKKDQFNSVKNIARLRNIRDKLDKKVNPKPKIKESKYYEPMDVF